MGQNTPPPEVPVLASILAALLSLLTPAPAPVPLDACPAWVACYTDPDCGGDSDMDRIADECGWTDETDETP